MQDLLRQMIVDSLAAPVPAFTRRDARLPQVPGKALAVIGMRRSGKTTYLWQVLADRLAQGAPREAQLYLNFEDDRLLDLDVSALNWILEEYFRLQPGFRDHVKVGFFLDEIQVVKGWEAFARRVMDTEKVDLFLSGSSARLLSREVATSMRGRGMEVLIHPFSFQESLRHQGMEPDKPWRLLGKAARSGIDHQLREYLVKGGFPEVQGIPDRDRTSLLRTYVDVTVLRDVIERYGVGNPLALRWLQRHLLANPGALFSVQKFHDALRSQGVPVSKDSLHAFLGYLEDTFLVRTVCIHAGSERKRMVNPRKAYPVDPGLIPVYERTGKSNLGHALETVVLIELERRDCQADYYRTAGGFEVDFVTRNPLGKWTLLQVCLDISEPSAREREVRALAEAAKEMPEAEPVLLTLDSVPPNFDLPEPLKWQAAAEWLLGDELE
ncbi:MAG: ATP-binding protein [Thermodesulfobacteriota bacterium]